MKVGLLGYSAIELVSELRNTSVFRTHTELLCTHNTNRENTHLMRKKLQSLFFLSQILTLSILSEEISICHLHNLKWQLHLGKAP